MIKQGPVKTLLVGFDQTLHDTTKCQAISANRGVPVTRNRVPHKASITQVGQPGSTAVGHSTTGAIFFCDWLRTGDVQLGTLCMPRGGFGDTVQTAAGLVTCDRV